MLFRLLASLLCFELFLFKCFILQVSTGTDQRHCGCCQVHNAPALQPNTAYLLAVNEHRTKHNDNNNEELKAVMLTKCKTKRPQLQCS